MSSQIDAGSAVREALRKAGDSPLLLSPDGAARTGTRLAERVAQLAGALAERRLAGRRIGAVYRNGFAVFEAFLAIESLGATRVSVDPDVPPAEAQAILDAAGVDVVLADREHAPGLTGDVLVHDDDAPLTGPAWQDTPSVPADTPAVIYPRQVVSGELQAVDISYGNWEAYRRINCELFRSGWYGTGFGDDECALTMQQLMHGTGLVASFPFLHMGLPQVVLPRFDADAALEAILRHRVTVLFAVPGMLTRIAERLETAPTTELPLRRTLYGGAPVPIAELRRLGRALGPSLVQLYGRMEAGWPLTVLGIDEHRAILAGDDELATSCGKPIPQIELRLAPAPGQPPGHGELQTRNPMVSPDYADPEGWCALGDVARRDDRGYLHLTGRLDGMINSGSYHIYPNQIAEVIAAVSGVADVKVTGEPDPKWGQAVTAYVVAEDPERWDALLARLHAELPAKLAKYKIPKAIHRVGELS